MAPLCTPLTGFRRLSLAVIETAMRDAAMGSEEAKQFLQDPARLAPWCWFLSIRVATVQRLARGTSWSRRCREAWALLSPRPPGGGQPPAPEP